MNTFELKMAYKPHYEVYVLGILLCFGVFKRVLGVSSIIKSCWELESRLGNKANVKMC